MEPFAEIAGGLIIVSGAVLIVYFLARFTYLIKRMRIEKGLPEPSPQNRLSKWEFAGIAIGIGVALLVSAPFSLLEWEENILDLLTWGLVLIMGAIGLMLAAKWKG